MPEGDTVWLAGHNLRRALVGQELVRTDFRVPRYATTDLSGRRVLDIVSRGKHLFWRFGGAPLRLGEQEARHPPYGRPRPWRLDGDVTLHSHFKMDGSWHLYRRGQRWRSPAFEARAVLETEAWQAVGFRMPVLDLIATERESEVVGHLGPDLLGDDWDPEEATARLGARRDMVIGEALLDQTVMAGVGNVYRCELCFLRGLNPWTPVPDVPDHRGVVDLAKRLLEANRHSARHVTTGVDRQGRSHYVYGRRGRPCLRCGTPIRAADQPSYGSKRIVYWCPSCQSL